MLFYVSRNMFTTTLIKNKVWNHHIKIQHVKLQNIKI